MCRVRLIAVLTVLLLSWAGIGSAAIWDGGGTDNSWCTGANWETNVEPQSEDVTINPVTPRDPVIDCSVDVQFVMGPRYSSDSDQSLSIESGTIWFNNGWRMGNSGSGASIVNISGGDVTVWANASGWTVRAADNGSLYWNQSGGSVTCIGDRFRTGDGSSYSEFNISGSAVLSIDDEWKWGDEGDVLMNMSGGSIDVSSDWRLQCRDGSYNDVNMVGGDIWIGGNINAADSARDTRVATINLKGGTIEASSLLLPTQNQGTGILNISGGTFTCRNELRVPNVAGGTGIINLDGGLINTASFHIAAGGTLDVNDGVLVIDGDVRDDIIAGITAGYIIGRGDSSTVTVVYDPGTLKTTVLTSESVTFETAASSGLETVSPGIVTVILQNPPQGQTVTVNYEATGGTAVGGGTDYTLSPGVLTFLPGETSQDIEIAIVDDGEDEDDETIELTLSGAVNAELGAITQHTYTIVDPRPYVAFDSESSQGRENVSNALIGVSLSYEWGQTVTVDYNVTGGTAEGNGKDYTLSASTLTFDPCEITKYISIDIVKDDFEEDPDETIEITLSNPDHARLGSVTQHTFTILPPMIVLCPEGDMDGDCDVDYNDVRLFVGQWLDPSGSCSGFDCGDIDGLNGVNLYDYSFLAADWMEEVFPVVINELMASNSDTESDEADEYDDWFELYNAGPVARDIGGIYLTDNLGNPTKWQIPSGLTIGAGEYIVFWADEDEGQGPTHTNFKLSASGEEIGLFADDGVTLLDSIQFGDQVTDISYGRYPDASSNERFFGTATPGLENSSAYLGDVEDTKFSHGRGFYESSFDLSITCDTPDANIYYTLDGSEPNKSTGTAYSGPITGINQTTVLRAAAFKPGYLRSGVDTQTYIFLDDVITQPTMDPCTISAHGSVVASSALKSIPTLSITLDENDYSVLSSDDDLKPEFSSSVELIYPDANSGEGFGINCGISLHSKLASKLSYRLEFKSELGAARLEYPFFESAPVNSETGVDRFDRIILRAASNMPITFVGDPWARNSQIAMCGIGSHNNFMHLYINGRYNGIYNPSERQDAWFTSAYMGGDFEDYLGTNHGLERCYECGGTCPVAPNSPCHLSGDNTRFDEMMAMAYEADLEDENKYAQFTTLCDVSEFADYTILFWLSGFGDNMDNNWYAGMRNNPPGGFMMFMWDAEYVFLNEGGPPGNEDPWVPYYYFNSGRMISDIWRALLENEDFQILFADRVYKHCFNDGALVDDNAQGRWNSLADYINEAAIVEVARWGDKLGSRSPSLPPVIVDMTGHVNIFLNALRSWSDASWPDVKLYPNIDPPTFNQHGGHVATGFGLTMTNPNGSGTIYYTLDGSDPRQEVTGNPVGTVYGGTITLNESKHVKARVYDGVEWSALNEATFAVGPVVDNIRVTEIMYHPVDANDPNAELIELQNVGAETVNLNLAKFTNGIDFTFGPVSLSSGQYAVVVQDAARFALRYPSFSGIIAGEYDGRFNNAGERVELVDAVGDTILNFRYEDGWREITDGQDYSLTIINPGSGDVNSWGEKDSWRASTYVGGSPGEDDSGIIPNPDAIVVNEVMSHSHGITYDWIELYNTTGSAIDISGWFLSDSDSNLTKYEFEAGTTINSGEYLVVYEDVNFGDTNDPGYRVPFALSENGEKVCLSSWADGNGKLTGYRAVEDFGASESDVSFGRYYKTSTNNYNFIAMDYNTPWASNAYPKVGPIVINEIMYHPDWPSGSLYNNEQYEYVELYNSSGVDVNLYDEEGNPWKFTDGINYTFGADANIPAGGYLVVVKNPTAFSDRYGSMPAGVEIHGPYDGKLSNGGEKVELSMPGDIDELSVRHYIRIDRVGYSDGSHPEDNPGGIDLWPVGADGGGDALSRIDVNLYGNDPNNWDASSPSPGNINP